MVLKQKTDIPDIKLYMPHGACWMSQGRFGYPRPNLTSRWQQKGIVQNGTLNDNGRIMKGDCVGGDPPRAPRALSLFCFRFLPIIKMQTTIQNPVA
ncbi:hypothetical protein GF407_00885 [candidate division KSB1 bacterium]|nr:hypothetical protein [candidate division KSB1 bacterium]